MAEEQVPLYEVRLPPADLQPGMLVAIREGEPLRPIVSKTSPRSNAVRLSGQPLVTQSLDDRTTYRALVTAQQLEDIESRVDPALREHNRQATISRRLGDVPAHLLTPEMVIQVDHRRTGESQFVQIASNRQREGYQNVTFRTYNGSEELAEFSPQDIVEAWLTADQEREIAVRTCGLRSDMGRLQRHRSSAMLLHQNALVVTQNSEADKPVVRKVRDAVALEGGDNIAVTFEDDPANTVTFSHDQRVETWQTEREFQAATRNYFSANGRSVTGAPQQPMGMSFG